MVITQQAAQSLAALNRPVAAGVCTPREQQDIALPLVIPFGMEMFDIFAQRSPQRALAIATSSSIHPSSLQSVIIQAHAMPTRETAAGRGVHWPADRRRASGRHSR